MKKNIDSFTFEVLKNWLNQVIFNSKLVLLMVLSFFSSYSLSNGLTSEPMSLTDEAGINILSGQIQFNIETVSIGSLSHIISGEKSILAPRDNYTGTIEKRNLSLWVGNQLCTQSVQVDTGDGGGLFCLIGNNWLNGKHESSTLIQNNKDFIFTNSAGDKYFFRFIESGVALPNVITYLNTVMDKIERISGEVITIHHRIVKTSKGATMTRIQSVNSSLGYQLKYEYPNYNIETTPRYLYRGFSKVIGVNNAKQYCSINDAVKCDTTQFDWPFATFNYNSASNRYTIKDYLKRTHTFDHITRNLQLVISKYNDGFNVSHYTYGDTWSMIGNSGQSYPPSMISGKKNLVMKVIKSGREWLHSYQNAGPYGFESKSKDSENKSLTVLSNTADFQTNPIIVYRIDGTKLHMDNQINSRLNKISRPEGYEEIYTYDARGNITQIERSQSSGSSTFTKASYDTNCQNSKKCNKPNWVEDAKGNKTYYSYYSSGLLSSITMPANRSNLSQEKRYYYTQLYPYLKDSSGNNVRASEPIWVKQEEIVCKSSNASGSQCTESGDEVVTTFEYARDGTLSNLQPIGKTISASGSIKRWCYEYDHYGNIISEITPLANLSSCQ